MLNSCVMHRHTGPAPGIMVWGGIGYHSHTPLVRIAGTLNSQRYISEVLEPVVLPYLQGLATAIFQQDNTRPHVAISCLSWCCIYGGQHCITHGNSYSTFGIRSLSREYNNFSLIHLV
ncbi:transposable element Tcb1 transposase [Trichonephila clavipes]|nr:transposable element Tcb1 transposase [Trichonephila clavipes]